MAVQLPLMLADPSFERLGEHISAPLLPAGFLNTVPKDQVAQAEWWNQHLIEVIAPSGRAGRTVGGGRSMNRPRRR
jgi:hypothetical protein